LSDKKEMTDEDCQSIFALPNLDTIFPYTFPNGHRIEGMPYGCRKCGKEMAEIKVEVIESARQLVLHIYAICFNCKSISVKTVRYSDDGTYHQGNRPGRWKPGKFVYSKKVIINKLRDFIFPILT
jgi:hypothetical protein